MRVLACMAPPQPREGTGLSTPLEVAQAAASTCVDTQARACGRCHAGSWALRKQLSCPPRRCLALPGQPVPAARTGSTPVPVTFHLLEGGRCCVRCRLLGKRREQRSARLCLEVVVAACAPTVHWQPAADARAEDVHLQGGARGGGGAGAGGSQIQLSVPGLTPSCMHMRLAPLWAWARARPCRRRCSAPRPRAAPLL